MLQLPPKVRERIIAYLHLEDALQLRLTCKTLNSDVEKYFQHFKMDITGDGLNSEQLSLVQRINLKKITFKRVAKPLPRPRESSESDGSLSDAEDEIAIYYDGPAQYFQVGGIQIRSLSAPQSSPTPAPNKEDDETVFDFGKLKDYLQTIGTGNIFNHVD